MEFLVAQLVPIFGIFMIIAVVVGPIWINSYFKSKERAQLHETLRLAYEKGQAPPPELIEKLTADNPTPIRSGGTDRDLRRAVVLIAVGIGLVGLGLGLGYGIGDIGGRVSGGIVAGAGAIPGFIGVAYFFLWLLGRRHQND